MIVDPWDRNFIGLWHTYLVENDAGLSTKNRQNGRGMKSGYPSTEALKTTLGGKEEKPE